MATYYVSSSGSDSTGNGTVGLPWATGHKASLTATNGDTVHFEVGTIVETVGSDWDVGVSLEGHGATSIIHSHVTGDYSYLYSFASGSEGTDGNQTISNLKFDGNAIACWGAIYIAARKNISVHDCTFQDFENTACVFNAKTAMYDPGAPITYATGNSFYNNIVNNCSNYYTSNYNSGQLHVNGQDGMLIYGNTMTQNTRTNHDGYLIKYYNEQFGRGIKIYNNTLTKCDPIDDSMDWNFCIEMWFPTGGIEIYENTIHGSIDCLGTTKGAYDYAVSIHNNSIGYASLRTYNTSGNNAALFFDEGQELTYVYENEMLFTGTPIQFYPDGGNHVEDIYIYNNLINGIGMAGGGGWNVLMAWAVSPGGSGNPVIDNFNFINNTVYADPDYAQNGLELPDIGDATNITVRNNIIQGFYYNPINYDLDAGETLDYLSIENNVFYDNGTNAVAQQGNAATHNTTQNNSTSAPPFVTPGSDFHLTESLDGIYISYVLIDYDEISRANPPDIGAFEYVSGGSTVTATITEAGTILDSISAVALLLSAATDAGSITDTLSAIATLLSSLTETSASIDTLSALALLLAETPEETDALDSLDSILGLLASLSEDSTVLDDISALAILRALGYERDTNEYGEVKYASDGSAAWNDAVSNILESGAGTDLPRATAVIYTGTTEGATLADYTSAGVFVVKLKLWWGGKWITIRTLKVYSNTLTSHNPIRVRDNLTWKLIDLLINYIHT